MHYAAQYGLLDIAQLFAKEGAGVDDEDNVRKS